MLAAAVASTPTPRSLIAEAEVEVAPGAFGVVKVYDSVGFATVGVATSHRPREMFRHVSTTSAPSFSVIVVSTAGARLPTR